MVDIALKEILIQKVEQALDTIRPYLKTDGGDVKVLNITEEKVVELELLGACGSCPMSAMTFKGGIEQAIMRAVPEITGIVAVNLTPMDV
ncbi:nitrogen fixation protein NifU [Rufibacter radiotolerans]|uniref:Nitrogen fixation protein NifU n=1 Tax=Rufibacter radiotolerans TaxID=1379910 RepID=A0A0H4VKK4_9BACT|nr:NifU family protein [Rufibacter radiotolerans]AKQ46330.1 nitrogen fixation protein NifU [Rufibacter radiotolerans]